MYSLVHIDTCNQNDTVIQMSRCSFDINIQDTLGTLVIGATIVMLHPRGNIDFEYLVKIMKWKQISCILTVPSLLYNYFNFVQQINDLNGAECLRTVWTGGM